MTPYIYDVEGDLINTIVTHKRAVLIPDLLSYQLFKEKIPLDEVTQNPVYDKKYFEAPYYGKTKYITLVCTFFLYLTIHNFYIIFSQF